MHAVAQRLSRAGVRMEEYPQSVPKLTEASQNLYELIQGRNLVVILTTRSGLQYPARWRRNPPRMAHCEGQAVAQDRRRGGAGDGSIIRVEVGC
jgi:hypothetical protein